MTAPELDVLDLVARLEDVERRLAGHDANLDRIEGAIRALAHGTGPAPLERAVGLATLRQLGDFPRLPPNGPAPLPRPDDELVHPTPRDGFLEEPHP